MTQQPKSATGFRKQVLDLLGESYGDKTLVLCPTAFVKLLHGDHQAAILLSQILFWSDRTQDPDGFFYKSYRDWQTETGLSETQVRRIINGDPRSQTSSAHPARSRCRNQAQEGQEYRGTDTVVSDQSGALPACPTRLDGAGRY